MELNSCIDDVSGFSEFVCCADLGGTNLRIAIFGLSDQPQMIYSTEVQTDKLVVNTINEVLKQANEKFGITTDTCVIGVAGSVSADRKYVKLTNADVIVDANHILSNSLLNQFLIINDLEATSAGILLVDNESLIQLETPGIGLVKPAQNANKAIIAAGTGLGEGMLCWQGTGYGVVPSEGGHSLIAATDDEQRKIVDFLLSKGMISRGSFPDYEDVLSGRGLEALYKYYCECMGEDCESLITNEHVPAELVSKFGLSGESQAAVCALDMFMKFYADECFNFGMKAKATGGIYICGNIAIKNQSKFLEGRFMQRFVFSKLPEHSILKLTQSIPVFLVKNQNVNLYGCANIAQNPTILRR